MFGLYLRRVDLLWFVDNLGGTPNSRLNSRLNCEAFTYPTHRQLLQRPFGYLGLDHVPYVTE